MEIDSKNLEDTASVAQKLLEHIKSLSVNKFSAFDELATVVGLYGDLGSGKTAFTKIFASLLGVEEVVSSPTFVIEKIYKIETLENFSHLIHIDAYRLESEDEMKNLGWGEILKNSRNIILIEWPEKIIGLIPKNHIRINFDHIDETSRHIKLDIL